MTPRSSSNKLRMAKFKDNPHTQSSITLTCNKTRMITEDPKKFLGAILADDIGFGKTNSYWYAIDLVFPIVKGGCFANVPSTPKMRQR